MNSEAVTWNGPIKKCSEKCRRFKGNLYLLILFEIFQNRIFAEHLWVTAFVSCSAEKKFNISFVQNQLP